MENSVDLVTSVFNVFSKIGSWFVEVIPSMLSIFYNETTGLTIIGILALCGLGVGTILMVFNLVRGFFNFS